VLRKKEARMPTNWSRRFKNHSEKLRSGDIYQVAEVVRTSRFVTRTRDLVLARSACSHALVRSSSQS